MSVFVQAVHIPVAEAAYAGKYYMFGKQLCVKSVEVAGSGSMTGIGPLYASGTLYNSYGSNLPYNATYSPGCLYTVGYVINGGSVSSVKAYNESGALIGTATWDREPPPVPTVTVVEVAGKLRASVNLNKPYDYYGSYLTVTSTSGYNGNLGFLSASGDYLEFPVTLGASYTIKAYSEDFAGNQSSQGSVSYTAADTIPPAAPANLVATGGNNSISLNWSANMESDLKGYNIYRDGVKLNTDLLTKNVYVDSGLSDDESHVYRVASVDNSGNISTLSAEASSKTNPAPIYPFVIGTSTYDAVTLSWQNGIGSLYDVYQIVDGSPHLLESLPYSTYTASVPYESSGTYYVVSHDLFGRLNKSNVLTVSAQPLPALMYPAVVVSGIKHNGFSLAWNDVAVSYDVFLNGEKVSSGSNRAYGFSDLTPLTSYAVKVVATDQFGRTSFWEQIVSTIDLPPSVYPVLKSISVSHDIINVSWTDTAKEYEVYLDDVSLGRTTKSVWRFNDLVNTTDYKVQVIAYDVFGRSNPSNVLIVTTLALPPPDIPFLTVNGISDKSLRLYWNKAFPPFTVWMDGTEIGTTKSQFYDVKGLLPSASYNFKVSYTDQFGRLVFSEEKVTSTIATPIAPSASPRPPVTGPVTNNPALDKVTTDLIQGVDDTKHSSMSIFALVIGFIIFVVGFFIIVKIFKRKASLASPSGSAGSSGFSGSANASSSVKSSQGSFKGNRPSANHKSNYNSRRNYYHGKSRYRKRSFW